MKHPLFRQHAYRRGDAIESMMVCARAMRDLCDAWKNTGRVDKLVTQAMSFAEVKKLLGVEEFLKLRERL